VRRHLDRGWPVGGEQGHRGRAVEVRGGGRGRGRRRAGEGQRTERLSCGGR
jgi:hypothetical protein